jgi:hypothetical protein
MNVLGLISHLIGIETLRLTKPIQDPQSKPTTLPQHQIDSAQNPQLPHSTRLASKPTSLLQIGSNWLRRDHPPRFLHNTVGYISCDSVKINNNKKSVTINKQ